MGLALKNLDRTQQIVSKVGEKVLYCLLAAISSKPCEAGKMPAIDLIFTRYLLKLFRKADRRQGGWLLHKSYWRGLLAIAISLLLVSCQEPLEFPSGSTVKIERVVSGQTIEIAGFADQTPILEQVRLIGIEAPDLKQQPWGPDSRQKLEQLIAGQQVLLESDTQDKDRYDRKLAYLWRGSILLNEELVKEGYALVVARSPNTKYKQRLANAQEWARLMGRGIWNPEAPMRQTPAEFRNQNRK